MPGPITAASRDPPSAAVAASTTPASNPRQPTWTAATAGRSPFARTSATGRQSAVKTRSGSPGASVHSPSPGRPCPLARLTTAPWTCRPNRSASGSAPTARHRRRRFSATSSGASSVRRPRLSVSYGASLTPPRRVEKATSYGPGALQRSSGSSPTDQLPRGGELGLAAVEVAPELPPPQLVEHLPHPRRLGQPELGEVGTGDVQSHVAQTREVVPQRRHLHVREREERCVGGVRIGERDHLGRVDRVAKALDEERADGDGRDDVLGVAPPHAEALEPGVRLVGRQPAGEDREPQPPVRSVHLQLALELRDAGGEPDRLLVRGQVRVDGSIGAELGETEDRV